jgi:hypothetical protein
MPKTRRVLRSAPPRPELYPKSNSLVEPNHKPLVLDEKAFMESFGAREEYIPPTPTPTPIKPKKVVGLKNASSEVGINPKDRIGASKVDFTLIPTSAKVAMALALMDGGTKYGPYNWRVEPIQCRTYLGAAERHLEAVKEGEQYARDSLIEHLGHVMACCGIVIDAMSQGTLVDDRPINGKGADIIEQANEWIKTNKPAGWGR